MIGKLYIIRNTINDKVYVGKTYKTIEQRFNIHKNDAKKVCNKNRKLYKAINTLGINNFYIEELGVYSKGILEKEEVKAIRELYSYTNGYNMTLGGEGTTYFPFTEQEVKEKYKELRTIEKTAKYFYCDVHTIRQRVKDIKHSRYSALYSLDYKRLFANTTDVCTFLKEQLRLETSIDYIRKSLSRHTNGHKKTYKGMKFLKYTPLTQW